MSPENGLDQRLEEIERLSEEARENVAELARLKQEAEEEAARQAKAKREQYLWMYLVAILVLLFVCALMYGR